ncbi:bifunctional 2-polyprenyl-6-hydroxyphenol methylase/3-demethylubiquinol 3-O-methyltransferase UbiG [Dechloromonas sp. HYN0024]|uniref:class I SAM-dependent methyltransferase n=1 Tax=Dechloromonas sp. HYN0024 TaxID=2231055 RepID=UPI0013C331DD|nr:methyltransferase domain-containing protein [Dechloromonas sp. HYN0024]
MTASLNELPRMIPPSPWVVRHCGLIAPGGAVLDLACGNGRHARLMAGLGFAVTAVDRDGEAILSLHEVPGLVARQVDLENAEWPLTGQTFAGIVVTNYLWRPRLPDLLGMLAPRGVLIYETFMRGNEAYGKPSSPAFLLSPGELREVTQAAGLREIAFEEGYTDSPKPAMRQAICAVRE